MSTVEPGPDDESGRLRQLCEVLEAEVRRLAGDGPFADAPPPADPTERLRWLEEILDGLSVDRAEPLTALCLSGGGIRSATFSLGVLQGLADAGVLRDFHYLSTVSGGGYIGGWLSSWIQRAGFDAVATGLRSNTQVEAQAADAAADTRPVQRLRAYTNYLSPVWGLSLDGLTLIATFLRNLSLHWCALLPLLFAILMFPRLQVAVQLWPAPAWVAQVEIGAALALLVVAITYIASDLPGPFLTHAGSNPSAPPPMPRNRLALWCMLPLFVAAVLLSWCSAHRHVLGNFSGISARVDLAAFSGVGALAHLLGAFLGAKLRPTRGLAKRRYTYPWRAAAAAASTGALGGALVYAFFYFTNDLTTPVAQHAASFNTDSRVPVWDQAMRTQHLYAALSVPALLLIFWIAVTLFAGLMSRITSDEDREWWSRAGATSLGWSVGWLILGLLVLCVPYWILLTPVLRDQENAKSIVGAGTGVLGALISAWGYWSKRGPVIRERVETAALKLGIGLLDLAALAFAVLLAVVISFASSWMLEWLAQCDWFKTEPSVATRSQEALVVWKAQESRLLEAATCGGKALDACALETVKQSTNSPPAVKFALVLTMTPWLLVLVTLGALGAFGVVAIMIIGVNTFSLHAMYGNRLVRAYLGATRRLRRPHWFTGFDPMDNLPLAALTIEKRRLFPVINTALNLAQPAGDRLEWQQRKAASFFFTPLASGSPALGFVPTRDYGKPPARTTPALDAARWRAAQDPRIDHDLGGVTLGRAVTISGAAASPNMGYHTSPLVAFAMSFFNVRLGWWMPNPEFKFKKYWQDSETRFGLFNVIAEATAGTSSERSFVYLSDGGHFENLGLYEMVRRRCRRIVLVDATADKNFEYADLESCLRKLRIDLGADVVFPKGLPTAESVRRTRIHYAVGKVHFRNTSDTDFGQLIYIKPALSDDLPLDVLRYARSQRRPDAAFPHDPTSQQNFDEAQFESYRVLGLHSARNVFDLSAWPTQMPDHTPFPPDAPPSAAGPTAAAGGGGEAKGAAAAGLGNAARNLAAGALLGTLAVTGTVALKDNQVVLKDSTVTLRQGAVVGLSPDASVKLADDKLADSINALANAISGQSSTTTEKLDELLVELKLRLQNDPNGARFEELLRRIDVLLLSLGTRPSGPITVQVDPGIRKDLQAIAAELSRPRPASQPAPVVTINPPQLEQLRQALDKIQAAIASTAPRRNVSGTAEGGRP